MLTYHPKAAKTLGVKLSDDGDAHARSLAGLPLLADSIPVLDEIAVLATGRGASRYLGQTWVPETVLASVQWGENDRRHKLVEIEEKLLPALARGLVEKQLLDSGPFLVFAD